jgi:hypothetical protein
MDEKCESYSRAEFLYGSTMTMMTMMTMAMK